MRTPVDSDKHGYGGTKRLPKGTPYTKSECDDMRRNLGYIQKYDRSNELSATKSNELTEDVDIYAAESEALFTAALEKLSLPKSEEKN